MVLDPQRVHGARVALGEFHSIKRSHPLRLWRAWNAGPNRTSQLRAMRGLAEQVTCFFGGNRSGKTELARVLAVCFALGGDHPVVVELLRAHGITGWEIPRGPGVVYIVAVDSNASRKYHRPQIARLLPKTGVTWIGRDSKGDALVRIEVPGYDEPAEIWFRSNAAGREAMQGDSVRLIVFDEEPDEDVFDEGMMRILDQEGARIVLSMTPLKGLTWVYDRYASTPDSADKRCHWIQTPDNPYHDPERVAKWFAAMPPAQREAREKGLFVTLEGRIFETFYRGQHVCEAFEPPEDWPRYIAIDFGIRNPFCCLWAALSPDDVLHVYREYYSNNDGGETLETHAAAIKRHGGWAQGWADPANPQLILDLVDTHGIDVDYARKDVLPGIDAVNARLMERNGVVGLQIHDACTNTIREIENYIWNPKKSGKGDPKEQPLKRNDHAMDCLRYMCFGLDGNSFGIA